jgi:hypothetical protein
LTHDWFYFLNWVLNRRIKLHLLGNNWLCCDALNLILSINETYSLVFYFSCFVFYPQTKLISWNIANFGQSKSDKTIHYIANYLRDYDIIAVQEVVAGYGGVQAVARLADELNRTGTKWDYTISDPRVAAHIKRSVMPLYGKPT